MGRGARDRPGGNGRRIADARGNPVAKVREARVKMPRTTVWAWSALSVLYASVLAWRWERTGTPPGAASLSGASAVAAAWGYLLYLRQSGRGAAGGGVRRAVYLLILMAVVFNVLAVAAQVRRTGAFPLVPALATFAFTMVFRDLITRADRES